MNISHEGVNEREINIETTSDLFPEEDAESEGVDDEAEGADDEDAHALDVQLGGRHQRRHVFGRGGIV